MVRRADEEGRAWGGKKGGGGKAADPDKVFVAHVERRIPEEKTQ